jgi:hypothetical protein
MRGKSNVIKRNVEEVWGVCYTLGARYLPKNMVNHVTLLFAATNSDSVFITYSFRNVTSEHMALKNG